MFYLYVIFSYHNHILEVKLVNFEINTHQEKVESVHFEPFFHYNKRFTVFRNFFGALRIYNKSIYTTCQTLSNLGLLLRPNNTVVDLYAWLNL